MRLIRGMLIFSAIVMAILATDAGSISNLRTDPMGGTGGGPIDGFLQVQVVQNGTTDPVVGAFVMVGPYPDEPFVGNWGFTSETGEITFSDPGLAGPITVTAGADGFTYSSLVSVDAADLVIPLKPLITPPPTYQVGDFVSGIDVNDGSFHFGDGNLDLAFVIPTLNANDIMSFDVTNFVGPTETIEILGEPYEIPSNIFLPQQWEVFIEINKDHYYVHLPAGDHTLVAMSGRVPLDALLGGGDITQLLPSLDWREIDILDVTISGNTNAADLDVDPDLNGTVTLNLSNIPDGGTAFCTSVGDLEGLDGMGRLVPLGFNSLGCPGGTGPCGGSVSLTTTAASGEFAGMGYFAAVAVQMETGADMLVILARGPHSQTYTEDIGDFYQLLDLGYSEGDFWWNDAQNPASGSPGVDLQLARLTDVDDSSRVLWEFTMPGDLLSFTPPWLPPQAPAGPVFGAPYAWQQVSVGLTHGLTEFDFNSFAISDILVHGTHLALDTLDILFGDVLSGVAATELPGSFGLLDNQPNPFNPQTAIHFELPAAAAVSLQIFDAAGRLVRTLIDREPMPAGRQQVIWNGRDEAGRTAAAGIYFSRLDSPGFTDTGRMMLVK